MPISFQATKEPNSVSLSKNWIPLLVPANFFSGGAAFVARMIIDTVANDGDTLVFNWGTTQVIFTFGSAPPGESGTDIQTNATLATLRNHILTALQSNYYTSTYFTFTSYSGGGDEGIDVVANNNGGQYDVDHTGSTFVFTDTVYVTGNDDSSDPDARVIVDLYVQSNFDLDDPVYDRIPLDQNPLPATEALFNFSKFLHPYVEDPLPNPLTQDDRYLPFWNQSTFEEMVGCFKKYYYRYTLQYGDPPVPQITITSSSIYYVMFGGLSFKAFRQYPNYCLDPLQYVAGYRFAKFLSHAPNFKIVNALQREYLYLLTDFLYNGSIKIFVDVFYENASNTVNTGITYSLAGNNSEPRVISMPADLVHLGIDPTGVVKYELYLMTTDMVPVQYSERKTFVVDKRCYFNERQFLFQNSLSGCETVRLTGMRMSGLKVVSQLFEKINNIYNYSQETGRLKKFGVEGADTFTISTGFYSREYITYLAHELMMSECVFEAKLDAVSAGHPQFNKFTPVIINTDSFQYLQDDRDQFAIQMEYRYAFDEIAVQPDYPEEVES